MNSNRQSARILLLAIGCLGVAGIWAYNHQLNAAKSDGANAANAQCTADTNAALLVAANHALTQIQQQLADANSAVKQLQSDKHQIEMRNTALQKEIHHVTTHWLPPGKKNIEPQSACVFTHGFVRVYNQSIVASTRSDSVPSAAPAIGVNGTANTAAYVANDLKPSDLTRADILQHIGEYGARCQRIESQLNRLLDYLEQQGTN